MAEKRNILDMMMKNARAKKTTGGGGGGAKFASTTASVKGGAEASSEPSSKKAKAGEEVEVEVEVEVGVNGDSKASVSAAGKKKEMVPGAAANKVDKVEAELMKKQADFDPKKAAFWKDGEQVPFVFFAKALDLIANESKRLIITEILCNMFRTVIATTPGDLLPVVYLSANKVAPAHEGIELGIGDAAIIKTLAEAYGTNEDKIKSQLKTLGDLGLVAKASRSTQRLMFKPQPLTCTKVLEAFRFIAKESGNQSQEKKRGRMKALLVAGTDCEPQYLVRLLQAKMRIGLAEQTMLVSLGQAVVLSEKPSVPASKLKARLEEAGQIMKHTYSVLPIYDRIVPALLDVGIQKLPEVCAFTIGIPVGPMLAKPTTGVSEVLDRFQDLVFTCEYKYDGERAQIHYMEDGSIEIYSRNAERNTEKFPDVADLVTKVKKPEAKSFVLDSEIVAYDKSTGKILPFQVLSTRGRKGVNLDDIKIQVCLYAFDLLYINGRNLLNEQLAARREELYKSFEELEGKFKFATATNTRELDEMQKFLDEAVNHSCEGLIVKTLETEATYEPTKRSHNWLKLKKDYMDSVGDSLDLVPIGGFLGQGKRTGVYGAFLLACFDDDSEEYQSICKIGTGFSEQVLEECSTSLRKHVIDKPRPYYQYGDKPKPDVWFDPVEVWEVKAADLTISPVHRAANGLVDPNKGISLRFPRLLRVREDKKPEEATTSEQVAEMYRAQKISHQGGNADDGED
ncbi:unnamed protein product [Calypogeia fissa]